MINPKTKIVQSSTASNILTGVAATGAIIGAGGVLAGVAAASAPVIIGSAILGSGVAILANLVNSQLPSRAPRLHSRVSFEPLENRSVLSAHRAVADDFLFGEGTEEAFFLFGGGTKEAVGGCYITEPPPFTEEWIVASAETSSNPQARPDKGSEQMKLE